MSLCFRLRTPRVRAACLVAILLALSPPGMPGAAELEPDPKDLPRLQPLPPEQAAATFRVGAGFELQLAAAEPLVADPIALAFDENGRLFVVEMRDYSERRDERLGRIRLLVDRDDDGRFEGSTVFAEDLPWPTAVICWNGGIFVGASPDILFLKDHDGDGRADERRVVFTGFARGVARLNVQALLNNFTWGLDNRIHGATSFNGGSVQAAGAGPRSAPVALNGRDFSFDPRSLELRAESGGGQHGLSFDDFGRKFVCSNSRHIAMVAYEERYAARNPHLAMPAATVDIAVDGPAAEVFRISDDEPWRIVRTRWRVAGLTPGPVEGGGRVSGYFTAATGITLYRGDAWPREFVGDAFIGDAGSNLIHRKRLLPDGVLFKAQRPAGEERVEFVACKDNWFRPVQFANAPDGCLYVADMYREVIEHPWSIPESIKKNLDLNSGNDRGRIYRIAPTGFRPRPGPRLGQASAAEWVATLEHRNGWHRDTAARLLCERGDARAVPALETLARESAFAPARLHALYVLEGLQALRLSHLLPALQDSHPQVRVHALRLAEGVSRRDATVPAMQQLRARLAALADDPAPEVRYQLAFTLGEVDVAPRLDVLAQLASRDPDHARLHAAVLSSVPGPSRPPARAAELLRRLLPGPSLWQTPSGRLFLGQVAGLIGAQADSSDLEWLAASLTELDDASRALVLLRGLADGLQRGGRSLGSSAAGPRLEGFFQAAATRAMDAQQSEQRRIQSTRMLGFAPTPLGRPVLTNLLCAGSSAALQRAALEALDQSGGKDVAALWVGAWPWLGVPVRDAALNAMLERPERAPVLVAALESGVIARDALGAGPLGRLRAVRDAALRRRVEALYPETEAGNAPVSPETIEAALSLTGRSDAGRKIYLERCASCHRLGSEGHALGPDLATVRSAGKEKVLTNILEPNREVAPNYVQYTIETRDGESRDGIIAQETATSVALRQANGVEHVFLRSQVTGMHSQGRSLMPDGLAAGLTAQDLADLLECVLRPSP